MNSGIRIPDRGSFQTAAIKKRNNRINEIRIPESEIRISKTFKTNI